MIDWSTEITTRALLESLAATMPPGTRVRVAFRPHPHSPQPSLFMTADGSEGAVANLERHRTGLLFVDLDNGDLAVFNPLDLVVIQERGR